MREGSCSLRWSLASLASPYVQVWGCLCVECSAPWSLGPNGVWERDLGFFSLCSAVQTCCHTGTLVLHFSDCFTLSPLLLSVLSHFYFKVAVLLLEYRFWSLYSPCFFVHLPKHQHVLGPVDKVMQGGRFVKILNCRPWEDPWADYLPTRWPQGC